MRTRQLRRHPGPDAQLRGARARQPRGGAERADRSRTRARRRCRDSPRRARSRPAASRRPCCRRTSARDIARAARARLLRHATPTIVARAATDAPQLLAACSSAAAMWTANAATVSPSADTADGRVHFTPANLVSHFHRSLEAPTTTRVLRAIFADRRAFRRARSAARRAAVRRRGRGESHPVRSRAGRARRRALRLRPRGVRRRRPRAAAIRRRARPARRRPPSRAATDSTRRARSSRSRIPTAIDAGVFHNDVIAVGHGTALLCHEQAWLDQDAVLAELRAQRRRRASRRSSCPRPR